MKLDNEFFALGRTPKKRRGRQPGSKSKPKGRRPKEEEQEEDDQPEEVSEREGKKTKSKKHPHSLVDTITDSVRFIRRFRTMASKGKVEAARLYTFIKSLQKAIHERHIRRSDRYAGEIVNIQKIAINAYQRGNGKTVQLSLTGPMRERLSEIVRSEKVRPSVAFLKRFVSLIGTDYYHTGKKMIALLESLDKMVKQRKITASDPYAAKVREAQKHLEKAVSSRSRLAVNPATLSGLNGFFDVSQDESPDFPFGEDEHDFPEQPVVQVKHGDEVEVMNSNEAGTRQYDTLPFTEFYFDLLKQPEKNFWMVIYGLPFQGKSSFALAFAKYLEDHFGKVLYIASEEWDSEGLKQKLNRIGAVGTQQPFTLTPSLIKSPSLNGFDFVFIDSANSEGLTIEQMQYLKRKYPSVAFIDVLQTTKDGDLRGDQRWRHYPGIVLKVEQGKAEVEKNRYSGEGKQVLELPASPAETFSLNGAPKPQKFTGAALLLNERDGFCDVIFRAYTDKVADLIGKSPSWFENAGYEVRTLNVLLANALSKELIESKKPIRIHTLAISMIEKPTPGRNLCLVYMRCFCSAHDMIRLINRWTEIDLIPLKEAVTPLNQNSLNGALQVKGEVLFIKEGGNNWKAFIVPTDERLAKFLGISVRQIKKLLLNKPHTVNEKLFAAVNREIQDFNPQVGLFRAEMQNIIPRKETSQESIFQLRMNGELAEIIRFLNHLYDEGKLLA